MIWNELLSVERAPAVACNWNVPVVLMLRLLKLAIPAASVETVVAPMSVAELSGHRQGDADAGYRISARHPSA